MVSSFVSAEAVVFFVLALSLAVLGMRVRNQALVFGSGAGIVIPSLVFLSGAALVIGVVAGLGLVVLAWRAL